MFSSCSIASTVCSVRGLNPQLLQLQIAVDAFFLLATLLWVAGFLDNKKKSLFLIAVDAFYLCWDKL